MKKIRDFFYNISDIFVIVVIIALAGCVIFWRMQTIVAYSASKTVVEEEEKIDIDFSDIDLTPEEKIDPILDIEEEEDDEPEDQDIDEEWKTTEEVEFEITSGTYNEIIKSLSEAFGLSKENSLELYSLLYDEGIELGADTRIGTGTFTIPKGSTVTDMIKIIARL